MRVPCLLAALLLSLAGCGRYFPTDLHPRNDQGPGMTVNDDGSVTHNLDRLAVTLKPMTDAELNRQFTEASKEGGSVNPYTFGDWQRLGDDFTPRRFTVFRLRVANYQFPKVRIDPAQAHITTANERDYSTLSFAQLYAYYKAHWLGRTGQGRSDFRSRTDILRQTLYTNAVVFSGSEEEGFLVFPRLDDDVTEIAVHLDGIALRFNYADEPVETEDLTFRFKREVLKGYTPDDAVARAPAAAKAAVAQQ